MSSQKPKVAASIDVGTNSVKAIVVDVESGCDRLLFERTLLTRLGEGMQASGMRLGELPMLRTLRALAELIEEVKAHGAEEIVAVGTAALREAENQEAFLLKVRQELGLSIQVISGHEEARLSYLAVRRDPAWREIPQLVVVDIGGGSTEIILGEAEPTSFQRTSLPIGAVRLTERFLRSDPPTLAELNGASRTVQQELGRLPPAILHPPFTLVGVGGTVTNLAAIDRGGMQNPKELHRHPIPAARLDQMLRQLAAMPLEDRRKVPGLEPARADIIVAGALILSLVLAHFGAQACATSVRGLRWGVLYDRFCSEPGA